MASITTSYIHPHAGKSQASSRPEPKAPQTVEGLAKYLKSLASGDNLKNYGGVFADMFWEFSSNEERFTEAVALIIDTTVAERDYVHLGVLVCQLILEKKQGPKFRMALMKWFENQFRSKADIRAVSIEKWLSVFAFMCKIHSCVLLSGQPISVLGAAIFTSIEFLLKQPDREDDEVDCSCSSLKLCGKTLEVTNQDKMDALMDTLRGIVISKQSSCRVRCLVLEILELRAMGWSDSSQKTLEKFYVDGLMDAVAQDEIASGPQP